MSASTPAKSGVPAGKASLTFLLASGEKKEGFLFDVKDTIETIRKAVYDDWPKEWPAEIRPPSYTNLHVLYRGRFIDHGTTLESNKIPAGEVTVVHLVVKTAVPEDDADKLKETSTTEPKCGCCIVS